MFQAGSGFGEIALISSGKRMATIVCAEDTFLMSMSKKAYNELISKFEPYFNSFLQNTMDLSWQEHCAYLYYQNYTITNAKSHLVRLEYIFYKKIQI